MPVRSKFFYWYVLFIISYAATFLVPRRIATMEHYELSELQYRLLSLTVIIPIAAIWYAAIFGYYKLRAYTRLIRDTPDGKHVAKLTTGVMVLAFGMPVASILSGVSTIISERTPSLVNAATIFNNYVSLIFPLISFAFISMGARGLSDLAKQRARYRDMNIMAAIFILISISYSSVAVVSSNFNERFHLPVWFVLLTIICPYLYTWYLGLISAHQVHLYARKAPGVLYRRTWNMLASGIATIIIMQIALQYISAMSTDFSEFKLIRLLIIIYVLLALIAVGYLLIAIGAKRLQKIEEV